MYDIGLIQSHEVENIMKKFILAMIATCLSHAALAITLPPHSGIEVTADDLWSVHGGQLSIDFNQDLLRDFKLGVEQDSAQIDTMLQLPIRSQSTLSIWAPAGAFDGYADGRLTLSGQMTLNSDTASARLSNLSIVPNAEDNLTLNMIDEAGFVWFQLTHIHSGIQHGDEVLTLRNMDLNLTPEAARRLNRPQMAGFSLGVAYLDTQLQVPANIMASARQVAGSCSAANAQWHDGVNFITDVALIGMNAIQQVNTIGSQIAIAPSATLENVGTADVPWYEKFTTTGSSNFPEPYDMDQHPFLVWNLYRLVDGQLEQLGASGIKHAFLTVNTSCTCSSGHILWADNSPVNNGACQDTYGVGNNNSSSAVGIREEVDPFTGIWQQCGSIYAPNGTAPGPCTEENFSIPFSTLERRLYVETADLTTPGADYYFEGWYVIRDDSNIFNSMGIQKVIPTGSGSNWSFAYDGSYTQGSVMDRWVDPAAPAANETHEQIDSNKGHFTLISRVDEISPGEFRYTYGLMNLDYTVGFTSMAVGIQSPAVSTAFDDEDYNAANDWPAVNGGNTMTWTAPSVDDAQLWSTLNVFEIISNDPPSDAQVVVTDSDGVTYQIPALVPMEAPLFDDGFEN